jgi:hypothetical protein
MNTDRIKEIQEETAYPESVSVQQALLKVWNETAQGFNLTDEDRLKRSDKLWKKLVKELSVLQDDNFTARQLFDYVERHYCQPTQQPPITNN